MAETEIFDGEQWTDVAPIPTPREHLAAASDGKYLYAVGGRELSSAENTGALERYDPARDTWTTLPEMPTPEGSFDATISLGHLVTVGGEQPTGVSGEVQSYDIANRTWSELPPLGTPRHGLTVDRRRRQALRDRRCARARPRGVDDHRRGPRPRRRLREPARGRRVEDARHPAGPAPAGGGSRVRRQDLADRRPHRRGGGRGDREHRDLRPGDRQLDGRPRAPGRRSTTRPPRHTATSSSRSAAGPPRART